MHISKLIVVLLVSSLISAGAAAESARQQVIVPTKNGEVLIEGFGDCGTTVCPAVIILSGSKGFAAPAYDEIGLAFRSAGLNVYLVHTLSAVDLDAIAKAGSARQRISYYTRLMPSWASKVQGVITYLRNQPRHGGKVGILGISLGAQIASSASVGRTDVDALVLVDGAFPNGHSQPLRPLPPMLLIWGGADEVFPISIAKELQRTAQQLGGKSLLQIYEREQHDFFLRSQSRNFSAAHQKVAKFMISQLSR